jgi:hypothetical protein
MERAQRVGVLLALILLLSSFGSPLALGQSAASGHRPAQSAIVVLAVDLREQTSLRDVPHVGDVFFRRSERRQNRANDDYDLAIRGSVASDWKSVFGGLTKIVRRTSSPSNQEPTLSRRSTLVAAQLPSVRALMHKATPLVSAVSWCERVRF